MENVSVKEIYRSALKAGQKEYRACVAAGINPYPEILDELVDAPSLQQVRLGLVEIPTELIVGTKTAGRQYSFTRSFLPLMDEFTEFCYKWTQLCSAHFSDEGIRDAIQCFEYYGKFYVQEGNKRLSVLRYHDAPKIPGYVIRLLPVPENSVRYQLYQEFLEFYSLAPIYDLDFTQPGSYRKLLAALGTGLTPWSPEFLQRFRSSYSRFCECMRGQLFLGNLTKADVLLVFLRYHSFREIHDLSTESLTRAIAALQNDIQAFSHPDPVSVSMTPVEPAKESFWERWILSRGSRHLRIAFVHERDTIQSNWTRSHELGRTYLEEILPDRVETRAYFHTVPGENADEVIDQAVTDGANVIFTTTPPLMAATLRASARHPDVIFLNCSVDMPYPDVRTYYGRVYEGKFITGAIAGAMARDGRIGYVGSYPIFGVPASINAFALGAQLVNPNVEIDLEWSCVRHDYIDLFQQRGITVVSNRDIPTPDPHYIRFGTFYLDSDGSTKLLASPVWHWGRLYEVIVRSILDGSWETEGAEAGTRAVNYWWGMNSGVIDVFLDESLPDGVAALANILSREIRSGQLDPFARKMTAQDGTQMNDGSRSLSTDEILHMDWLCDCVHGEIPPFEKLLPMARATVRMLGVYRDRLPPEEEMLP